MACFRFVTFLPLRPDFSFPCFIALISRSTDFEAFGLYLRPVDFFFALDFFAALFFEAEPFFALLFLVALLFFDALFFALLFFELVFLDGMLSILHSLRSRLTLQRCQRHMYLGPLQG